jgi:AraC family transcriptional regulator, transcriptional activator of pobA
MKTTDLPVYSIGALPGSVSAVNFHLQRLEDHLVKFPEAEELHGHDFYLLVFVSSGAGTHTVDFVTYPVAPGQLYFLVPGQIHNWAFAPGSTGYVVFFTAEFYVYQYPGRRLHQYPFFGHFRAPLVQLATAAEPPFQLLLEQMAAEAVSVHANRADVFRAYLYALLEVAARHYEAGQPADSLSGQRQLREFEQLIDQHFRVLKSVHEYADRLHLTPNYLNALCRQHLHHTASELIQRRVVVEAQRLLTHSTRSVQQVADALGFDDPSYFSRYFRKHTGQTPEQFRRRKS